MTASNSRAESQHTQYSNTRRQRSNTATSLLRPPITPLALKIGDSKTLNLWVHDAKENQGVVFNHSCWPGVGEGDMIRVTRSGEDAETTGFLFIVPKDDGSAKPQSQISIPKTIADTCDLRNNNEVVVTKVDREKCSADYVELIFQDQYLGRNDMWRLGEHLVGQCVHVGQEVQFVGAITAKIQNVYVDGKKVSAGHMTPTTKTIFRSLSAKVTIFIQVCRELWEFSGDGERYNEKIVHSFLPALFTKWREAGTNHTVTIMLISRVYYDEHEIDYAAGPLRKDDEGHWYKDFYKLITDLEVIHDWKPTLVKLKASFWAFQRDILLTHHHHQATLESAAGSPPEQVRLVGQLSFAHDGPILEALNLGLNPTETHYIDRSLSLTGTSTLLITPGTGYFRVSKQLLRLTTTRMLDQGFGLDLVSLAKPPLHQSPIFSFQGLEPEPKDHGIGIATEGKKPYARATDPLWGGDHEPKDWEGKVRRTFWWEPFWIGVSFWDKQMDLPIREDRFIARAKLHEIQMLGLLEHDVLSSIEVPFLPEYGDPYATPQREAFTPEDAPPSRDEAERADMETFALNRGPRAPHLGRNSFAASSSVGSGTIIGSSSYRSGIGDKRASLIHRNSIVSTKIGPTIEESPIRVMKDLPDDGLPVPGPSRPASILEKTPTATFTTLSSSPSQSSMRSVRSNRSSATTNGTSIQEEKRRTASSSTAKPSLTSKFAPSWLFNPFRSGPSEPQTTAVSASAVASPSSSPPTTSPARPIRQPAKPSKNNSVNISPLSRSPGPMTIKGKPNAPPRSTLSRTFEEENNTVTQRSSTHVRHPNSPVGTPPREDTHFGKRRSTLSSLSIPMASSSPVATSSRPNPSRPQANVSYTQASLARRWQHMFPQPVYKHEIKWRSMVTPGCLPLSVEHFPSSSELDSSYDVFSYDFVIDPTDMRSFLIKPPVLSVATSKYDKDEVRRGWALRVMRGMVAVRLVQGFQFILRPHKDKEAEVEEERGFLRRNKSYIGLDDDMTPKPAGTADILRSTADPVYLSMSNEIHRISYTGEAIQVKRYVRRMPPTKPFEYECLIWPKLGVGYTELKTTFTSHGLENYGWNRLDMLVAGYERQFNDSLRYWRTRFVIIPTAEPPESNVGPSGEELNDEETRLMGIDKLAEMFSKLRWQPSEERSMAVPPVRFLPTTLGPSFSVHDQSLLSQLDEIHAAGPLRKKMKSEREIGEMSFSAIAKAMREEDGVPIKHYQWHNTKYPNSFTGYDFVSWLVREFRDVGSRVQGAEWGVKLQEQGLFDHCRGLHGFLDGHYFYRMIGEYAVPMTPRGWFTSRSSDKPPSASSSGLKINSPRRNKKRLILSQSMVIDIDPSKRSDQAESVILHHDIIHNPATVFHFELQWVGTTARCIEDQLRLWGRTIERYGLKLVEAYVTEISDIRDRNAFQSCFPLRLAAPPPSIPDIDKRVPEGTTTRHYFEYALLRKFGFILDIEAADLYPEQVDVVYSYRRNAFKYSQFVHRSGVAFVQVLGGSEGFLFLTNRLMGPGRIGTTMRSKEKELKPAVAAEEIRQALDDFCSDADALKMFYIEEMDHLGDAPEEPPELSI